jgi:aspartyl-tRNA(Asn)/glutamyl-tRNA(Gln) amidotransferase subunit A
MDPQPWSASDLRRAILAGDRSVESAVRDSLERVEQQNAGLGAFITVDAERALERARILDARGDRAGALFGLPVALKDNICLRGMETTAGSRILKGYVPPYSAAAAERLESAGAVVIGKTNCDEFAMGSSTEHSAFGPARNPWDRERTPGGSSGGSAAAVAAGLVPLALGSDTGGSVRQPAALCGVVGGKPTYGLVSRYGLIAFASSLDQIGPLAGSVRDAALLHDAIAGPDARDSTSVTADVPAAMSRLDEPPRHMKIGVPRHLLERGVDPEITAAFESAVGVFASLGVPAAAVELPHSAYAIAVYYLVATAEASSNLARYDGVRYGLRVSASPVDQMYARTRSAGFGSEVKRRLMLGTYALSAGYYDAFYLKAQQVRQLIRRDFDLAFANVDAIVLPTSPIPAFKLGERLDDPLQMYLADVFTVGASLAGLPAVSIPCGLTTGRLPVGLQIIGRAFEDATVYQLASAFERATPAR